MLSLCTESESTKATTKRSGARGRTLHAEGTEAAREAVIKFGEFGPVLTLTWQLRVSYMTVHVQCVSIVRTTSCDLCCSF